MRLRVIYGNSKQPLHDIFFSLFAFQSSSIFSSQFLTPPSLHLLTVFLLSVISSLLPLLHVAQLYLFMHALVYSMNILIRCCCWDPFLYGAPNLYSWPRTRIRCLIVEKSCPIPRKGMEGIIFVVLMFASAGISLGCTHRMTPWLRQGREKKDILDLCVTHGGFWSSSLTCDADLT